MVGLVILTYGAGGGSLDGVSTLAGGIICEPPDPPPPPVKLLSILILAGEIALAKPDIFPLLKLIFGSQDSPVALSGQNVVCVFSNDIPQLTNYS